MVRPTLLVVLMFALAACIESNPERTHSDTSSPTDRPDSSAPVDTIVGDPCEQSGDQRCREDRGAIEICGDDHVWHATSCGDARICIDFGGAHCLETTGEQSCRDLLYCFLGCSTLEPDRQQQCSEACFVTGTAAAQEQLDDTQQCMVAAGCTDTTLKASLDCIGATCGTDLAFCYYPEHGAKGCAQIVACQDDCNGDTDCARACGKDSTIKAQAEYAVLELCIYFTCVGQPDNNECVTHATDTGGCREYATACLNPLSHD